MQFGGQIEMRKEFDLPFQNCLLNRHTFILLNLRQYAQVVPIGTGFSEIHRRQTHPFRFTGHWHSICDAH